MSDSFWKLDKGTNANQIATQKESSNVGGKVLGGVSTTRCATYSVAVNNGCKHTYHTTSNRLVRYDKLSKAGYSMWCKLYYSHLAGCCSDSPYMLKVYMSISSGGTDSTIVGSLTLDTDRSWTSSDYVDLTCTLPTNVNYAYFKFTSSQLYYYGGNNPLSTSQTVRHVLYNNTLNATAASTCNIQMSSINTWTKFNFLDPNGSGGQYHLVLEAYEYTSQFVPTSLGGPSWGGSGLS